jgi:hypothetical protein
MGGVVVSGARWCAALDGTRVAGVGLTQSGARGDAIRGMAERASERFHRRLVVVPISGDAANLSTDRRQRIGAGLEIRDGVIEEINEEKRKLKVMVKIFGRRTPLELNYNQVQKL